VPSCRNFGCQDNSAFESRLTQDVKLGGSNPGEWEMTYPCYYQYKDTQGYWRWTYYASNGKAISVASEGYYNKSDCTNAINIMKASTYSTVYEAKAA
jgi:uncharacterized protein YegP (UPF0339 family)